MKQDPNFWQNCALLLITYAVLATFWLARLFDDTKQMEESLLESDKDITKMERAIEAQSREIDRLRVYESIWKAQNRVDDIEPAPTFCPLPRTENDRFIRLVNS